MNRGSRTTMSLSALLLSACLLAAGPAGSVSAVPAEGAHEPARVTSGQGATGAASAPARLPGGGKKIFGAKRFLVAYYGTAATGALGVLGESDPDTMHGRLKRAARPFKLKGERIQPVYELIVTVADAVPGPDGDYNHDVLHSRVQEYIDAAQRNNALLVLDLQPGRSDFLTVAKRWEWALAHPWVGLALDPEWRMTGDQVPGQSIGSVRAKEVNEVSQWLEDLTAANALPQKLFVIHQFQSAMVGRIKKIADRDLLAEVQHVDGFGTPAQKLSTYATVARPQQFTMGFKLFYDEDVPRMRPRAVRRALPGVRFVSFQ